LIVLLQDSGEGGLGGLGARPLNALPLVEHVDRLPSAGEVGLKTLGLVHQPDVVLDRDPLGLGDRGALPQRGHQGLVVRDGLLLVHRLPWFHRDASCSLRAGQRSRCSKPYSDHERPQKAHVKSTESP
jgi:hypothetical protein